MHSLGPTRSEKDPARRVQECMEAFPHSKSKMAQEIRQTLSEWKQSVYTHTHARMHAHSVMTTQTSNALGEHVHSQGYHLCRHVQAHLITKLESLHMGTNTRECLEYMRERAYHIGRKERAKEENKPAWYVVCVYSCM